MARGIVKGGLNDGGSNIKSIQRGSVSFSTSALDTTATISPVDITKSIVRITYIGLTSSNRNPVLIVPVLTNGTTITFTRKEALGTSVVVRWEVIEYNNVKSKQTGTIALNGATAVTATVTAIDMTKVMLVSAKFGGGTEGVSWSAKEGFQEWLASTTTISFLGNDIGTMYWQLLEFN